MAQPKKAGGTRGFWDVLSHPIDVLRDPTGSSHSKTQSDLEALAAGETRQVSCWLRGSDPELPQKLTQGILLIGPDGMAWHHWFRHKDHLVATPPLDRVEQVIRQQAGQPAKAQTRTVLERRYYRSFGEGGVRCSRCRTGSGAASGGAFPK